MSVISVLCLEHTTDLSLYQHSVRSYGLICVIRTFSWGLSFRDTTNVVMGPGLAPTRAAAPADKTMVQLESRLAKVGSALIGDGSTPFRARQYGAMQRKVLYL